MPPRKKFNLTKYVNYIEAIDKSMCLVENCDRGISGKRPANIKRHYKLVHKLKIDYDDSDGSCNEFKIPKKLKTCDNVTMGVEKAIKCEIGTCKSTDLSEKIPLNKGLPYDYELDKVKLEDEDCDTSCSNELETNKILQTSDGIIMDTNEFIKSCVGLVMVKNIPFRIFDDHEYFKKIIAPYEQKFGININSKNISLVVEKASEEIKDIITGRIDKNMVCLKVNIGKGIDRNILDISIQYINEFKICINTIGMVEIPKNMKTAQFFAEEIRKCLQDFKIEITQLYSNTFGNHAQVISVPKIKQEVQEENIDNALLTDRDDENILSQITAVFPVILCAADTLQLAAYDVLKTLDPELDTCRQIVKRLRTSLLKGDIDIYLPSLDNMENWTTIFSIINSILVQKELIQKLDNALIIGLDWNFMENFVTAFNPLVDCTMKFQSKQYVFGDFYRDWLSCELELLDITDGNLYACRLHEAMATRKKTLIGNDVFIAALYLDPRYNFSASPLLSDDQKNVALQHLMKTFEIIQQLQATSVLEEDKFNIPESETTSISTEYSLTSSDKYNKLEKHIQLLIATATTSSLTKRSLKQKLSLLCERSMEPLDTNVLEYWSKCYKHDRELSKLAEVALAVPVTHEYSDVERAFSALSDQLGTKESLSNILLYNFNSDLLHSCNLDFLETEEILIT